MSPRASLRVAALATLGCTTSFDLSGLPRRDVPAADASALDRPNARDAADDVGLLDAPGASDLPDLPDVGDAPDVVDALRCGGAGEPCCARVARPDPCDPGVACDLTQRCARCAVSEALCDGRCVDLARDDRHCGACGVACAAQTACRGGGCAPIACAPGFDNCDAASGCATDLQRNSSHCGRCGVSCARPNAVMACSEGRCVLRGCVGTYADCDGDVANGCETALHNDPQNCGACGRGCPASSPLDHIRRACVNGACQRRCEDNWYDCNGDPRDCEIGVTDPICAACDDPRCRLNPLPPDGRERRCCTFMRGTVTCCSQ